MKDPEVKALIKLVHPNIVKLKEVIRQSEFMFMIFELLEKDLGDLLRETIGDFLTEDKIRSIMSQILKGVYYMHKNGYFHRDLKPENILIDGDKALYKMMEARAKKAK